MQKYPVRHSFLTSSTSKLTYVRALILNQTNPKGTIPSTKATQLHRKILLLLLIHILYNAPYSCTYPFSSRINSPLPFNTNGNIGTPYLPLLRNRLVCTPTVIPTDGRNASVLIYRNSFLVLNETVRRM